MAEWLGRIDDDLRERIVELLLAAADRDAPRIAESLIRHRLQGAGESRSRFAQR